MEVFAWICAKVKKLNITEMRSLTMKMVLKELGCVFVRTITNVIRMLIGPDVGFTTISEMVQC